MAYSVTVPVPQPLALMLPLVDGHTLSVIVSVGASGVVQLPGTVVTPEDSGLVTLLSRSQLQRVLIVCAGPVCA